MIGRRLMLCAVLAAATNLARAAEHETVTVLRECPTKGWHRACLPVAFFFQDDGSGRLRVRTRDDNAYYPTKILDHLLVKGSLLENRGQGTYRLMLDYQVSESEADSPDELGDFAFVGHSRAGHPIVLTDKGPLEIQTSGVVFDRPVDLYVVREKSGQLVAQVVGASGMPFVVTKRGDVGVWDSKRSICVTAPTNRTQELAIITTACRQSGAPDDGTLIGGHIELANDIDDADARRMIGIDDSAGFGVYRAPGLGILLIWVNWQYCC